MTMDPGKYRWRCMLQAQGTTQDELGQPTTAWVEVARFWADIRFTGGLESIKAGAVVSQVQGSIRLRWRTGINSGMRVVCGATVYNILAVLPDLVGKQHVDLVCEVVQ